MAQQEVFWVDLFNKAERYYFKHSVLEKKYSIFNDIKCSLFQAFLPQFGD